MPRMHTVREWDACYWGYIGICVYWNSMRRPGKYRRCGADECSGQHLYHMRGGHVPGQLRHYLRYLPTRNIQQWSIGHM